MKVAEHFLHFFTPRHTNNHRAKVLHTSTLGTIIALLIVVQVGLTFVHQAAPQVLGYASNISISDLLNETNSRRRDAGAGQLALNDQLNNAAAGKASDMFANQYWAHVSPQGKEPWAFITGAGYNYVFAGENLARDFGDSHGVVDAWMNSPSHKENLLNARFQDVGFAILNGKYGDSETTLVVQMFGSRSQSEPSVAVAVNTPAPTESPTVVPSQIPTQAPTLTPFPTPTAAPIISNTEPPRGSVLPTEAQAIKPKFDILSITRGLAFGLTLMLLGVLAIDAILIYRRKTVRISGHNFAHVLILAVVLIAVSLLGRGTII